MDKVEEHRAAFLSAFQRQYTLLEKDLRDQENQRYFEAQQAKQELIDENFQLQSRVAKLEAENKELRVQNGTLVTAQIKGVSPAAEEELTVPYKDYKALTYKYNALKASLDLYTSELAKAKTKLRQAKNTCKAWQEYVDKVNNKKPAVAPPEIDRTLKSAEASSPFVGNPITSPGSNKQQDENREPAPPEELASPPLAEVEAPHSSFLGRVEAALAPTIEEPEATQPNGDGAKHGVGPTQHSAMHLLPLFVQDVADAPIQEERMPSQAAPEVTVLVIAEEKPGSSQDTEAETQILPGNGPASAPPVVQDEVDDYPTFVSARSLKRKREQQKSTPAQVQVQARGATPSQPVRIKEEKYSSPPRGEAKLYRTETMDLDEPGLKIDTPRKRKRFEEMLRASREGQAANPRTATLRHERSNSLPPSIKPDPDTTPARPGEVVDRFRKPAPPSTTPARVSKSTTKKPSARLAYDSNDHETPVRRSVRSGQNVNTRALNQLSTNKPLRPPTNVKARRKLDEEKLMAEAVSMGEAGEGLPSPTSKGRKGAGGILSSAKASRLYDLLRHSPSTDQPLSLSSRSPHAQTRGAIAQADRDLNRKQEIEDSDGESQLPVRPEDEPLRLRPMENLNLSDFKINSKYNEGLGYAYTETVRGHDARRCLPGCTRPDCCGTTFRKVVELGGLPVAPRRGLWDSSQDSDDEERRLLEDYLGDDRGRLRTMDKDEREELLIQAKTRQFANQHGRHRHAFERRQSPPGFWRTDFPTTQEEEDDRQAAFELERRKVEERYREAMRGNGRWTFRDE